MTKPTSNLNFANSLVSFSLPGGNIINDEAAFNVLLQYRSANGLQLDTSETGPISEAQSSQSIPEPGALVAAALLAGGAAYARWRKRKSA